MLFIHYLVYFCKTVILCLFSTKKSLLKYFVSLAKYCSEQICSECDKNSLNTLLVMLGQLMGCSFI